MSGETQAERARREQIAAAKAVATAAPVEQAGPEWPDWRNVTIEDALTMIEVDMWSGAAKIAFGLNSEATGMWGRINYPKWSPYIAKQGKSSITFGSGLDHVIRKLAQLTSSDDDKVWKPDPYAK